MPRTWGWSPAAGPALPLSDGAPASPPLPDHGDPTPTRPLPAHPCSHTCFPPQSRVLPFPPAPNATRLASHQSPRVPLPRAALGPQLIRKRGCSMWKGRRMSGRSVLASRTRGRHPRCGPLPLTVVMGLQGTRHTVHPWATLEAHLANAALSPGARAGGAVSKLLDSVCPPVKFSDPEGRSTRL